MTGRQEPSDVELRSNLDKRMFLLPHGPPTSRPSKRFNTKGTNGVPAAKPVDNSAISLDDETKPEAATRYLKTNHEAFIWLTFVISLVMIPPQQVIILVEFLTLRSTPS